MASGTRRLRNVESTSREWPVSTYVSITVTTAQSWRLRPSDVTCYLLPVLSSSVEVAPLTAVGTSPIGHLVEMLDTHIPILKLVLYPSVLT